MNEDAGIAASSAHPNQRTTRAPIPPCPKPRTPFVSPFSHNVFIRSHNFTVDLAQTRLYQFCPRDNCVRLFRRILLSLLFGACASDVGVATREPTPHTLDPDVPCVPAPPRTYTRPSTLTLNMSIGRLHFRLPLSVLPVFPEMILKRKRKIGYSPVLSDSELPITAATAVASVGVARQQKVISELTPGMVSSLLYVLKHVSCLIISISQRANCVFISITASLPATATTDAPTDSNTFRIRIRRFDPEADDSDGYWYVRMLRPLRSSDMASACLQERVFPFPS